jgi:hypothetical protein
LDAKELFVRRNLIYAVALAAAAVSPESERRPTSGIADAVMKLTRESPWRLVASVPMTFPTHHPQGMVKIGDTLFVSAVEVTTAVKRFPSPVGGYDRDTGAGIGHLFKIDMTGKLLADTRLGEGSIYHPGGIDYDGHDIWVPVAEYRPNSRSIVYRVDPGTLKIAEVFRVPDHIGGIVHNTDDNTLHGVSWGSRRFYRWTLDSRGRVAKAGAAPVAVRRSNTSHYVDYQDCKYAGAQRMLCTGVTELRQAADGPLFRLGGLDLVDLRDGRPLHQVPVLLWTPTGLDMTHNPAWFEVTAAGLRGYFMPEDNRSTLYIYEVSELRN